MENSNATKLNPFFSIWLQPRASIRQAIDQELYISALVFAACTGTQQILSRMIQNSMGDELSLPVILGLAVMFGIIAGAFGLCFGSWLLSHVGRWLGGTGYFDQLLIAGGYSSIPGVWVLTIQLFLIALFGQDLFLSTGLADYSLGHYLVLLMAGIVLLVISIWGLVISCKAVGEAHGFSAWRGLSTLLIATLIILIPILLLLSIF